MGKQTSSEIGRSRIQRVFVVMEDTRGVLKYPTKDNFILVANDATLSQSPEYTDSPEKTGTRDIIEQFPNAMPPAQGAVAMVLRPAGIGQKPQGYDALLSLFGSSTLVNHPVFTLGIADDVTTTIPILTGAETLPPCGVILVGTEQIAYNSISEDGTQLLNCKRGVNDTTAAAIISGEDGTYKSIAFIQDNSNPSFSYFLQTDHFLQAASGCTVNTASFSVSNEGPVLIELSEIQGMRMTFAGTCNITQSATAGDSSITVVNPKAFKEGIKIWSPSVDDHGPTASSGYIISSVDNETGVITLASAIQKDWPVDSSVAGFLPQDAVGIGEPLTGVNTKVYLDSVQGKMRTTSLTYNNTVSYLTDEVGTEFPEDYVEGARTVELSQNIYFRKSDAIRFQEGYEGVFVHERFEYQNGKAVLDLPRVRQTMPAPNVDGVTVTLDISGTVLGAGAGNNAVFLILN